MNWLQYLMTALSAIPYLVVGIQQIHAGAPGSTKKQIAMQSLGLATNTASAVAPGGATEIQTISQVVSQAIDGVVTVANAVGAFGKDHSQQEPAIKDPSALPAATTQPNSPIMQAVQQTAQNNAPTQTPAP